MATLRERTVHSSGAGGGYDYTSLSAWEAGEQTNLVTADEIRRAVCYSFEDTTAVSLDTWTSDATRYVEITAHASARHPGYWDTSKYRLNTTGTISLEIITPGHVRVYGIQIRNSGTGTAGSQCVDALGVSGGDIRVFGCYLSNTNPNTIYNAALTGGTTGCFYKYWNNICVNTGQKGNQSKGIRPDSAVGANSSTTLVFNNTVVNYYYGLHRGATTLTTVINNLFENCTQAAFGTVVAASGNNATTNASMGYTGATGSGDRVNQIFTFVGAGDYHLDANDAGAKGYGRTDPGGGLFSDDIDGDARVAPWDIGADEFVESPAFQVAAYTSHGRFAIGP